MQITKESPPAFVKRSGTRKYVAVFTAVEGLQNGEWLKVDTSDVSEKRAVNHALRRAARDIERHISIKQDPEHPLTLWATLLPKEEPA